MGARRRSWARLARVLVVALALGCLPSPASASTAPEDDLAAAQERANQAAAELAEAQAEMARAEDALASVQTRVDTVEARVDGTRAQVRDLAIRLYVGGSAPMLRILGMADANDVIRAQQYSHVVVGASMDALEQYRSDREDLRRELAALEEQQAAHAETVEAHRARQADVMEELDRLTEVVAQATAAQEAERLEAERRATAAAGPSAESSSAGQSTAGALTATPTPVAPPTTAAAAPATIAPPDDVDVDAVDPAGADWLCPVQGPHAFSDDYGAPRGGGFSHQGNDILAARGTPVVASVDGVVRQREGAVSGLAYYLDGDDGNEYFGAHLDSFGASGRVTQGTVVGRVGNTGDAASTSPHLHFEIHPGGSGYENPYPTLTLSC